MHRLTGDSFIGGDRGPAHLLKRERFLRLSRGSYLSSKMFYLLCISAIQSLLFIVVGNLLIGIGSEMFLTWWITLWATSFLANLTGLILSQSLNSIVAIYITIPLLLIPQILLCGLVVKFDDLSRSASSRNIPECPCRRGAQPHKQPQPDPE